MKRLAVFMDGTWNEPDDRTNVTRLRELALISDDQLVEYWEGVGTKWTERLRGGALGKGLSRNVRDAYKWLAKEYEDGDKIYLFGFSRGAYTARSLAGMIAKCGLLHTDASMTVRDIFDRYRMGAAATPIHRLVFASQSGNPVSQDEQDLLDNSRRVDIEFMGVWDTVGALGVPFGRIRGWSRRTFSFHNTNPSTLYKNMYHAIAIDEHRKAFDATLWTGFEPKGVADHEMIKEDQTIEQRWFLGDHGDVGGSGKLASIPLAWIQENAAANGLAFSEIVKPGSETLRARHGDSFGGFAFGLYRVIKFNIRHRRRIGRPRRETKTKPGWSHVLNETIDGTVFERWQVDNTYRPRNLKKWAARKGVDLAKASGTMSAQDPQ